ncbi:hypothetical protein D3C76_582200 [compost metagenome]
MGIAGAKQPKPLQELFAYTAILGAVRVKAFFRHIAHRHHDSGSQRFSFFVIQLDDGFQITMHAKLDHRDIVHADQHMNITGPFCFGLAEEVDDFRLLAGVFAGIVLTVADTVF